MLKRAQALAKTATKNYATIKQAAEASVTTWQWATKQTHSVEPGHFECYGIVRGKRLASKPATLNYHAQEGFDAEGRIVVVREYIKSWTEYYERFYRYERDGIADIRFAPGKPKVVHNVRWFQTKAGIVTGFAWVTDHGHRSRTYRFDDSGHYAGYTDTGLYQGKPLEATGDYARDIECDAAGAIVRVWWLWPTGKRDLYWEKRKARPVTPARAARTTRTRRTRSA